MLPEGNARSLFQGAAQAPQIFETFCIRPLGMKQSNQILSGDQQRGRPRHRPLPKIWRQMPTRDLIAVSNLLVYTLAVKSQITE